MVVEFAGEAYEAFQRVTAGLSGYTVKITPETGWEFDAELLGPDLNAEDGATVRIRSEGQTDSIIAKRIYVY